MSNRSETFFAAVWGLTAEIPAGRVATYGQLARLLRRPRNARLVGFALHATPRAADVPAHRVVAAGGRLSAESHFRPDGQRARLAAEGVPFLPSGHVDLQRCQWQPQTNAVEPL